MSTLAADPSDLARRDLDRGATMTSAPSAPPPLRASVRWLTTAAIVLTVAVVVAPLSLATLGAGGGHLGVAGLRASLSSGLVAWWRSGDAVLDPALARAVESWARFHLIKAVLAALLLPVLVLLARQSAATLRGARGRRRLLASSGTVTIIIWTLLVVLILLANVQGAIAPLSSALGLLDLTAPGPALASTLTTMRHDLATGDASPVLAAVVRDFVVYHAAMVIICAAMVAGLLVLNLLARRRRSEITRAGWRARAAAAAPIVGTMMLAGAFALVAAANLSTVFQPTPALISFLAHSR